MRTLLHRIAATFRRRRSDERLDEEVQAHLEALAADYERRGLTPEQARYAARRDFGGIEPMKEAHRDWRGLPWLDDLRQDLRFARRGLVRTPGFACVAVLTLTVGIGANAAIFSLVDAALLEPLPVRQPHELVLASHEADGRRNIPVAAYEFRALRAHRDVLAGLAAFRPLPVGLSYRGETEMALGQLVSGNYHGLLGVSATLGRVLTDADDVVPGNHPVAVISEGYWQRRFGGSGTVIGEPVHINGRPFTIVGVSARGFMGTEAGRAVDVTIPLSMQVGVFGPRPLMNDASQARWLYLLGRLAPGVTREQAEVPLALEWDRLAASRVRPGRPPSKQTFRLLDGSQGRNDLRERFSLPLRVLMAMVVLVLLIACANLATLLIARSNARRQEVGLRLALGASRGRLLRQLLTESLLLSTIGGALGVGLAYLASGTLVGLMAGREGGIVLDVAPSVRTILFTLAVSLVSGVLFGSFPSMRAARFGMAAAARAGAGAAAAGRRWSQTMVVAQVAVSLLLLVEAGLFARSLSSLRGLDTGFTGGRSVLLANIRPSGAADGLAGVVNLFRDLSGRLPVLQARSVTFTMDTPLGGVSMTRALEAVDGLPQPPDAEQVSFNFVGPHFFETMGIPLEGRDIRVEDDERAPAVAVVSRLVATRYFPGVNAVGKRIRTGGTDFEIVGVAADVKYQSLRGQSAPMVYLPYQQGGRDAARVGVLTIAIRAIDDARETAAALRREVRAIAPGAVIARLMTLEELTNGTLARERVVATLSVLFGAIALLLGCIGLYGTLAYAVTRRTSELGVRIAMGASRSRLVAMVLGESLRPVAFGIVLGVPLAFAAGRSSESLLFNVTGRDLTTYLLAMTMLAVSAVCASWLPARRAASVDPVVALRSE
jgi:predicted permease